jgi:hypothetical protein
LTVDRSLEYLRFHVGPREADNTLKIRTPIVSTQVPGPIELVGDLLELGALRMRQWIGEAPLGTAAAISSQGIDQERGPKPDSGKIGVSRDDRGFPRRNFKKISTANCRLRQTDVEQREDTDADGPELVPERANETFVAAGNDEPRPLGNLANSGGVTLLLVLSCSRIA